MCPNIPCSWGIQFATYSYQVGISLVVEVEDSAFAPVFGILLVVCWSGLRYFLTRLFEDSLHFGFIDLEGRIVLACGFSFFLRMLHFMLVLNLSTFSPTWWTVILFDSLQTILALGGLQDKILKVVVRWLRRRQGCVARKLVGLLGDQSMLEAERLVHIPTNWSATDRENIKTAMHVIHASSTIFQEILIHVIAFVMLVTEFVLVHTSSTTLPLWNYHHQVNPWTNRSLNEILVHQEVVEQVKVIGGFALLVIVECCNAIVVYSLLAWDVHPLRQSTIARDHDSAAKLARRRVHAIATMASTAIHRLRTSKFKHRKISGSEDDKSGSIDEMDAHITNAARRDLVDELSTRGLLQHVEICDWDIHVFPIQVLERHWQYVFALSACGMCAGLLGAAYFKHISVMKQNYAMETLHANESIDYRVMKFEEFISAQIGRNYTDMSSVQNTQCIRDLSSCRLW